MNSKKHQLLLLLVLTPFFWQLLKNSNSLIIEWSQAPVYFNSKIQNIFSQNALNYIEEYRWENAKYTGSDKISRIYYNKSLILADQAFDFLSFSSPRIYFQAGDGSNFSPNNVEPIPIILFPFFIIGIICHLRGKNFRALLFLLALSLPAFATGQKNFAYLFPFAIAIIYTSSVGIEYSLAAKSSKSIFMLIYIIYSIFLLTHGNVI
jgi:hypothetical protein